MYSENVDLQRSASLTFAEITERGKERRLETLADSLTDRLQMYEKLTETPLNLSYSSYRAPILKCNGLQVQLWGI